MAEPNAAGGASPPGGSGLFGGLFGRSRGASSASMAPFGARAKISIDAGEITAAVRAVDDLHKAFKELATTLDQKFGSSTVSRVGNLAAAAGGSGSPGGGNRAVPASAVGTVSGGGNSGGGGSVQDESPGGYFAAMGRTLEHATYAAAGVNLATSPIQGNDQAALLASQGQTQLMRMTGNRTVQQVTDWARNNASRYQDSSDLYAGTLALQPYGSVGTAGGATAMASAGTFTSLIPGANFTEGAEATTALYSPEVFSRMRMAGMRPAIEPGGAPRSTPTVLRELGQRAWQGHTRELSPEDYAEGMRPGSAVFQNLQTLTAGDQGLMQSVVNYMGESARFAQAGGDANAYDPNNEAMRRQALGSRYADARASADSQKTSDQQRELLLEESGRVRSAGMQEAMSGLQATIEGYFPGLTSAITTIAPLAGMAGGLLGGASQLGMISAGLGGGSGPGIFGRLLGRGAGPAATAATGAAPAVTATEAVTPAVAAGTAGGSPVVAAGLTAGGLAAAIAGAVAAAVGGWMGSLGLEGLANGPDSPVQNAASVGQWTISPLRSAFRGARNAYRALSGTGDPVSSKAGAFPGIRAGTVPLTRGNDIGGPVGDGPLAGPGRTSGMDPGFLASLQQMFQDNPALSLTSGFRTYAEQVDLYRRKPGLAAKPGTSKHEKGLAADIGPESQYGWLASNAARYGLEKTVSYEPWHFEPNGSRSASELTQVRNEEPAEETGPTAVFSWFGDRNASGAEDDLLAQSDPTAPSFPFGGGSNMGTGQSNAQVPTASGGGGAISVNEAARYARSAGLTNQSSLITALAIAIGESGLRTDARGDTGITDATWGPSIGLWQIRSYNSQKGTGGDRDEVANLDPGHNARAMMAISGGGSNWSPWSVFKSGAYRANLGRVQSALSSGIGDPVGPSSTAVSASTVRESSAPVVQRGRTNVTINVLLRDTSDAEIVRVAAKLREILHDGDVLDSVTTGAV